MDIVIIGSGNVAAVLGRKFKSAGHTIVQVYSRNAKEATALAYEWDTESTNYKSLINKTADVYIIAVSDDAIEEVTDNLKLPGKVVAHTAASVAAAILKNVSDHYGVFYPLQSLRKETKSLPEIPIYVDGHDEKATMLLKTLAHSIADEKVILAGDNDRLKLHVAAVIVSNFTNHLYTLAENYCRKEGLDFKQLLPLIEETALRIKDITPQQAQTGPAIRHDKETIEKHLSLLKEHPHLKSIYLLMTESIQQVK
ncbi:MAG TPA: F420-dependent NADP oxidoreductase [Chitinophagaceae bacterium]